MHKILTQHIVPFSGTLTHFHYNIFDSMRYGQNVARRKRRHPCIKKRRVDSCRVVNGLLSHSLLIHSVSIPTLICCKCRCLVPVCVCVRPNIILNLSDHGRAFPTFSSSFPFAMHLCTLYTYRRQNENIRCYNAHG